jgi:hypothetical protein
LMKFVQVRDLFYKRCCSHWKMRRRTKPDDICHMGIRVGSFVRQPFGTCSIPALF